MGVCRISTEEGDHRRAVAIHAEPWVSAEPEQPLACLQQAGAPTDAWHLCLFTFR